MKTFPLFATVATVATLVLFGNARSGELPAVTWTGQIVYCTEKDKTVACFTAKSEPMTDANQCTRSVWTQVEVLRKRAADNGARIAIIETLCVKSYGV